jgi:hypothetical protein
VRAAFVIEYLIGPSLRVYIMKEKSDSLLYFTACWLPLGNELLLSFVAAVVVPIATSIHDIFDVFSQESIHFCIRIVEGVGSLSRIEHGEVTASVIYITMLCFICSNRIY